MSTRPETVALPVEPNDELLIALGASCATHLPEAQARSILRSAYAGLVAAARRQAAEAPEPRLVYPPKLDPSAPGDLRWAAGWNACRQKMFELNTPAPAEPVPAVNAPAQDVAPAQVYCFLTKPSRELSTDLMRWMAMQTTTQELVAHAKQGWRNVRSRREDEKGMPFPAEAAMAWLKEFKPDRWAQVYCGLHDVDLLHKDTPDGRMWSWKSVSRGQMSGPFAQLPRAIKDAQVKLGLPA